MLSLIFENFAKDGLNLSLIFSSGPFRCFAMLNSACPSHDVSGLESHVSMP